MNQTSPVTRKRSFGYPQKILLSVLFVGLVALVVLPQADNFKGTVQLLMNAPPGLILIAAAIVALSYVLAAASYVSLGTRHQLRLLPTIAVQAASGFTNRLLPAGLGAAGLYILYLKRYGFRGADATALVAANNILGAFGNVILLVVAFAAAPRANDLLRIPDIPLVYAGIVLGVIVLVVLVLARHGNWLHKTKLFISESWRSLKILLRPGIGSATSLACNMGLTSLNALALSLAVIAVGGYVYWPLAIIVLSVGQVLGAAVPTPGGLGGVEAGILGGLIACGVPAASALAATVIYRGLAYWLPIIPGIILLPWVRRRYLYQRPVKAVQ